MRKLIAICIVLACTVSCKHEERPVTSAGPKGGPFIASSANVANDDPASFSPLKQTGNGKNVLNEVYETLIDQNGFGGAIYGDIAKDWSWRGNDLIVNLYDYVYDSAGNHITAKDVVFSYQRDWSAGYTLSGYLTFTTGADAVSDTRVVFHFKPDQVNVYGNVFILLNSVYIVSQAAWTSSKDKMAVDPAGTGPYQVTKFIPGAYAVLTRRDNYWQKPNLIGPQHRANVETITYKFITDPAQMVNALKTGDIDYASNFSPEALGAFQRAKGWTVTKAYDAHTYVMWVNAMSNLPMGDINLRAALFYAIDVEDMVNAVGGENFARKISIDGVPGTQFYNPAWEKWTNYYTKPGANFDLAKQYMAKSSYKGQTLKIVYESGQYSSFFEPISLIIGAACEKLGIKYQITASASDVVTAMVKTADNPAWDIYILNQGTDGSMMKFIQYYFNTRLMKGGLGNYHDNVLDAKFATLYSVSGATQANFDDFEKYVTDKYYVYGFFQRVVYSVYNSSLIKSADVATFRDWVIPGSFTYVGQ